MYLVSSFTLSLQCCNQTKLRRPAACLACSLDEVQGGDVVFRDLILVKVAGWVVLQKVPVAKCQIFSTKDLSVRRVEQVNNIRGVKADRAYQLVQQRVTVAS